MTILKSKLDLPQAVMEVCRLWADARSKDPRTKVGACVYDTQTGGLFLGYNGFASGIPDDEETWNRREPAISGQVGNFTIGLPGVTLTKYDLVIHAEVNAVRKALRAGVDVTRSFLVCTHAPCPACMKDVILAERVPVVYYCQPYARGDDDAQKVLTLAKLGNVKLTQINDYFRARDAALDDLLKRRGP